jgi:hypothetical protein
LAPTNSQKITALFFLKNLTTFFEDSGPPI